MKLSTAAIAFTCTLSVVTYASDMMLQTNPATKKVEKLSEMFTQGVFYGRLRTNYFKWDWKNDDTATTANKDNKAFGLGGSVRYKSASFNGISTMAGLYFTSSPFRSLRQDESEIAYVRAGKDTFSRYQVSTTGVWEYAVLAEANIQYEISKTKTIAGRQIFESFLTNSNDTKMIPNTFEAVVLETKELTKTRIRGAYITAQKLRDHTTFHDLITFKDASGNSWANNDDSAVHKGLSYQNFVTAGKDVNHELIVVDLRNTTVKNLKVDLTYGTVPDVVSSITGEVNYKIALGNGYTLTPGARYMKQLDGGGGAIGGATLKGSLAIDKTPTSNLGYQERYTLNSSLWMARLVVKKGALQAKIAYSAVEDAADIVAPWRGFPTGGYTRAMGQYNWYANTKTWNIEANYDFDKAGFIAGFSVMARYAMQNFDEAKQIAGIQADSNIFHVDVRENFGNGLYAKLRIGLVTADSRIDGIEKDSYTEYRFELNYLF